MGRALLLTATLVAALGCVSREIAPAPPSVPARVVAATTPVVAPEPPPAPVRNPALIEGELGGWTPSDDLVVAALRLGDSATRAAAGVEFGRSSRTRRVDVLRAGLRVRDVATARTCAVLVAADELDDWESRRSVALGMDAVLDPTFLLPDGTVPNCHDLMHRMDGDDLGPVLDRVDRVPAERLAAVYLDTLHRAARPAHLSKAAAFTLSADPSIRLLGWEIVQHTGYTTDQHRDDVAAAYLGLPIDEARRRFADAGPGLPRLLVAVLEQSMRGEGRHADEWAWGWLADSTPAPRDRDLLVRLRNARGMSPHVSPWTVPWQLEQIDGRDAAMIDDLAGRAVRDGDRLAELLTLDPKRGRAVVETTAFGGDDDAAAAVLGALRHAWEIGADGVGVRWDASAFDGFEDAALRARPPGRRLALVGVSAPGCRTRRIAEAALAAMDAAHAPVGVTQDELAFLETAAPAAFRARLVSWARSDEPTTRGLALATAYRVGAPELGAELVAWIEADPARGRDARLLARSASPAVREHVAAVASGARASKCLDRIGALAALAACDGLPDEIDFAACLRSNRLTKETDQVATELVLARRPRDALVAVLAAEPDRPVIGLGRVDDDRVRAHLAACRRDRGQWLYVWATAESALAGDADARAEMERLLPSARLRTIDRLRGEEIILGDADAWLPHWAGLLESNCCMHTTLSMYVFDDLLALPSPTPRGETRARTARRAIERAGGRFVRSRVLGRYIAAPR